MKRSLTLLLASLLVVFGLSACGGNDTPRDQDNQHDSAVVGGNAAEDGSAGTDESRQPNSDKSNQNADSDQTHSDNSLKEDAEAGMDDVKEDVSDAVQDAKDAMDDAASKARMRAAHPHDKDGDLTDQENGFARNSLL